MAGDVAGLRVEFTAAIKLNRFVTKMPSQYLYLYAYTNIHPEGLLFALGNG